ncbi:MAG: nuclear transport factor 2 family protein [Actinomycetota bacterium]
MSEENVEIVRAINDAFNRGDATTALQWVDPEIEAESWVALGAEGAYRGKDGILRLMASFWESFDNPRAEIEECIPAGDDVVIGVRYFGRGKASGIEVDTDGAQVVTLRDGKVVRWRIFQSMAEALEAAGLRE